jgi:glucose/arabinose dehydrogenase
VRGGGEGSVLRQDWSLAGSPRRRWSAPGRWPVWLVTAVLLLAACGDGDGADTDGGPGSATVAPTQAPAPSTTAAPTVPPEPPAQLPPVASLRGVTLTATQIAPVETLTAIAWRPGDPDPYLGDQHGVVYHVVGGTSEPVLDLTAKVMDWQPGAEYGFLAMTFDPRNGRLVVCYNGNDVNTRVESYAVTADGRPDANSAWDILLIEKPGVGHNCGQLVFARDNTLFVSHGDGGGSQGADAQDMTKLLGGIFRIAPNVDGPGYKVPQDNPYVGREGIAPEIWAKGMRNPWRFSIDDATGDIWVGDVGESTWESVYRIPAGQSGVNCGWPTFEGGHEVNFGHGAAVPRSWTTPPVYFYSHADVGPAVIGGYVYRGKAIPQLNGAYIFADMTLPIFALGADGVTAITVQLSGPVTSFGQDPNGELYVLTLNSGAYRLEAASTATPG